jgi:hypothetical protein
MQTLLSDDVQRALEQCVRMKMAGTSVLDVQAAAEEIRLVFADRNIAREDIAASVTAFAALRGYPMEFALAAAQDDR